MYVVNSIWLMYYFLHFRLPVVYRPNKHTKQSHGGRLVLGCRSNTVSLSFMVFLSQEGGGLVDSSGGLRVPFYTAWLELVQKEVTSDLYPSSSCSTHSASRRIWRAYRPVDAHVHKGGPASEGQMLATGPLRSCLRPAVVGGVVLACWFGCRGFCPCWTGFSLIHPSSWNQDAMCHLQHIVVISWLKDVL